jgi:hypothetical protein
VCVPSLLPIHIVEEALHSVLRLMQTRGVSYVRTIHLLRRSILHFMSGVFQTRPPLPPGQCSFLSILIGIRSPVIVPVVPRLAERECEVVGYAGDIFQPG